MFGLEYLWKGLVWVYRQMAGYPNGWGKLYSVNFEYRLGAKPSQIKSFCQMLQKESPAFIEYRPEGWQGMYEYVTNNFGSGVQVILDGHILFKLLERKDKWPLIIDHYEDKTEVLKIRIPTMKKDLAEAQLELKKPDLGPGTRYQLEHTVLNLRDHIRWAERSVNSFNPNW